MILRGVRGFARGFECLPAAADAAWSLLAYVQISHFVTKVLIRKRFR
jgi:hypothetical protein